MQKTPAKYRTELDEFYFDKVDDPKFKDDIQKINSVEHYIKSQLTEAMTAPSKLEANVKLRITWDGKLIKKTRRDIKQNLLKEGDIVMWVNAWNAWFLANSADVILPKFLEDFDTIDVPIVPVTVTFKDRKSITWFFINDAWVGWWGIEDTFDFKLETSIKHIEFFGSWVVVNTPVWSTWWAANLWQTTLPINSKLLGVAWIWCKWYDYSYIWPLVNDNLIVTDTRLRNPLKVILDGKYWKIYTDIESLIVHPVETYYKLWFAKWQLFQERRTKLSEETHWNRITRKDKTSL